MKREFKNQSYKEPKAITIPNRIFKRNNKYILALIWGHRVISALYVLIAFSCHWGCFIGTPILRQMLQYKRLSL